MPIPSPRKRESKNDFISRCMGDSVMNDEFTDQKQRAAVCYQKWSDKEAKAAFVIHAADDTFIVAKEETEDCGCGDTIEASKHEGKTLNKPFRLPKGSNKKFGVYVKNEKGNVVMVKFGDPNMEIKRDNPERRSNFRSRHNCDNPGPKTKARYWSCKMWSARPVSQVAGEEDIDWDNLPEQEIDASIEIIEENDI